MSCAMDNRFSFTVKTNFTDGAAEFLRKIGDETIVLFKDKSRPKVEKEQNSKILTKSIDMKTIGRFGRKTWREITDKQRSRYWSFLETMYYTPIRSAF